MAIYWEIWSKSKKRQRDGGKIHDMHRERERGGEGKDGECAGVQLTDVEGNRRSFLQLLAGTEPTET